MKWIAVAVFMAAVLTAVVNTQTSTTCTDADFIQVGTMANISADCGLALAVNNLPASFDNDAGINALNTACTRDCIGRLAQPLLCRCGDLTGIGARTQCYRTDPTQNRGITFCRQAYADVANFTVYDAFRQSCLIFQAGEECPPDCAVGLQDIVAEIGCCFQNVLNSTLVTTPEARNFTGATLFYDILQNAMLWSACGVTIPSACAEPMGIPALNQTLCEVTPTTPTTTTPTTCPNRSAPGLLATKAVAVFLLLLAYFAM